MPPHDEEEAADVFDFVDAYLADLERGDEKPLSVYLARFPRNQDAIAREYVALKHPRTEASTATPVVEGAHDAQRVGPYRILRELGRGGQGTVFLAEDSRIARRVALKVLTSRFDSIADEKLKRFRREADVIARLEHPGLCTIYDADIDGTTPWIAMRYVEGRTLAECIADAKRAPGEEIFGLRMPPSAVLDLHAVLLLFERAARALHAAHEAGVVHRDVKPGNIVVTLDGRPVLLDFGLARDEQSEVATITQSGDVFGTPAYMSPEQLTLRGEDLDRRTDVYSLGVALYEALTLQRPFENASRTELYRAIQSDPPPDPRKKNPHLGEDVKVVLETALEKERERRYPTALEFAEDLRRIREYEPIHARPASVGLRFARWTRRHPALAVAIIGTIVALSIGLGVSLKLLANERSALARERAAMSVALGNHFGLRAVQLAPQDPPASLAIGIRAVELAPNDLTRSNLFTALDACWLAHVIEVEGAAHYIKDIATSPIEELAAIAFDDGSVALVDLSSGARRARLSGHTGCVNKVAFSPDGARVLTASSDGTVRLFDTASQSCVNTFTLARPCTSAMFDARGTRIVATESEGEVRVFDARTFALVSTLEARAGEFARASMSPDGSRVLAHTPGQRPAVFDAQSGRRLVDLASDSGASFCAFSRAPGSVRVLVADANGAVRLVDPSTGLDDDTRWHHGPFQFESGATNIAESPDGSHLAVLVNRGEEGWAYLCSTAEHTLVRLEGHDGRCVTQAAFSPDGTRLATTAFDLCVRIWSTCDARSLHRFTLPTRHYDVCWSASGDRLLTRTNSGYAHTWFARSRPDMFDLEGHTGAVRSARFSPDGSTALTASDDGTARLWRLSEPKSGGNDVARGATIAVMRHASAVVSANFSADGRAILTLDSAGSAGVFDARDGAPLRPFLTDVGRIVAAAIDTTGERVVTLSASGTANVWSVRSNGAPLAFEGTVRDPRCVAFSADGALVAIAGSEDVIHIHDPRDGRKLRSMQFTRKDALQGGVVALAFRPSSAEIAVACRDKRLRFFRTTDGEKSREDIFAFEFKDLAFSRDGARVLLTSRWGGSGVRSIELARGEPAYPKSQHSGDITSACYSRDGALVMTTSKDGSAYVWNASDSTPVTRREDLGSAILAGDLSASGSELRAITGCMSGRVCVWPVDPLPAALARRPRVLTKLEEDVERELAAPLEFR